MMKHIKLDYKDTAILLFIVITAIWRILIYSIPHISAVNNFSPLGAMALFGGAYLTRWKGIAFPILTLWLSDVFLNRIEFYGEWVLFYEDFMWVYGAFALMALIGRWLQTNKSINRFLGSSLAIVFIHWIVTDIGVWLGSSIYPQTLSGLWACLVAAIPYEMNFLAGTLFYGIILFGSFEILKRKIPALQPIQQSIQ
jgi:hypothetical protein